MQLDADSASTVSTRLRRARGQIDGVLAMIEAVDRAAFTIVSCGLRQVLEAEAAGEEPPIDKARLEKLFLSLA